MCFCTATHDQSFKPPGPTNTLYVLPVAWPDFLVLASTLQPGGRFVGPAWPCLARCFFAIVLVVAEKSGAPAARSASPPHLQQEHPLCHHPLARCPLDDAQTASCMKKSSWSSKCDSRNQWKCVALKPSTRQLQCQHQLHSKRKLQMQEHEVDQYPLRLIWFQPQLSIDPHPTCCI